MDGYEVLVHNLSHSDMILTVKHDLKNGKDVIARPKFSKFKDISQDIVNSINNPKIHKAHHFSRSTQSFEADEVGIGFDLFNDPVRVLDQQSLRYRHEEMPSASNDSTSIIRVCFPLIAVLVPKWLKTIESSKPNVRRVVILVSGKGTPSDVNANMMDNSTKYTAQLIQKFLELEYPDVEVRLLDSDTNLFRYDHNIIFVKHELLPVINEYRDKLVSADRPNPEKWKDNMKVTLSFADGSSARISAINASLRHYRPSYMHFWQLKSYWRDQKICEDDIECHSFEEICTEPAVSLEDGIHDPLVRKVVTEMEAFRKYFDETIAASGGNNDLDTFWLRKSKKPVLAVLLVQKPGKEPKLYRGTNMEVSMPTGSLCAERNVIGSALADDITLKRQDLKIIAVYSGSLTPASSSTVNLTTIVASPPLDPSPEVSASKFALFSRQDSIPLLIDSEAINAEYQPTPGLMGSPGNAAAASGAPLRQLHRSASEGSAASNGPRSPLPSSSKRKMMRMSSINGEDGGRRDSFDEYAGSAPSAESPSTPSANSASGSSADSVVKSEQQPPQSESVAPSTPRPQSPRTTRSTVGSGSGGQPQAHGQFLPPVGRVNGSSSGPVSGSKKRNRTIAFKTTQSSDVLSSLGGAGGGVLCQLVNGGSINTNTDSSIASVISGDSSGSCGGIATIVGSASVTHVRGSDLVACSSQTFVVDENDINPLKPCGACNEWLKKIAEVNPQLKVVTFTDASCRDIFIENVED